MKKTLLKFNKKYSLISISFVVMTISVIIACTNDKSENINLKLFGNTFLAIEQGFKAPDEWIEYPLMEGRCSIALPPNLKETSVDGGTIIPKESGTTFVYSTDSIDSLYHYCRVAIDYYHGQEGTFASRGEHITIPYKDLEAMLKPLAIETLGAENEHLLLNGPLYFQHYNSTYYDGSSYDSDMYLDICYRRKSDIEENNPVSLHVFLFQDNTDMVKITMSFHDKDSLVFKKLFQSVQTFKWHR